MAERILRPWVVLNEKTVFDAAPFLHIAAETIALPDGRTVENYHRVRMPDVATVYAETMGGNVIVLRSYRHGIRRICYGFPGGHLFPGEATLEAARRELREETGYEAASWQFLGSYVTNANHGCQTNYFFRATNCHLVAAPASGDLEESEIILLAPSEIRAAFNRGDFPFVGQLALFALVSDPSLGTTPS